MNVLTLQGVRERNIEILMGVCNVEHPDSASGLGVEYGLNITVEPIPEDPILEPEFAPGQGSIANQQRDFELGKALGMKAGRAYNLGRTSVEKANV